MWLLIIVFQFELRPVTSPLNAGYKLHSRFKRIMSNTKRRIGVIGFGSLGSIFF